MNLAGLIRDNLNNILKVFLFVMAVVLLIIIFPREGKFKYEFQKGKPWLHDDLYAPFDFPISKTSEELQREQQEVDRKLKPYFNFDEEGYQTKRVALQVEFADAWKKAHGSEGLSEDFKGHNLQVLLHVFDTIFQKGIIRMHPVIENKPPDFEIIVVRSNKATAGDLANVLTIPQAKDKIDQLLQEASQVDRAMLRTLLLDQLTYNLEHDLDKTETEKKEALSRISLSRGMIQRGQLIISRGKIVTGDDYLVLQSLKQNYEVELGTSKAFYNILAGQSILISVSMLMLALFLRFYRLDILANNKRVLLILMLITVTVFAASMVLKINPDYLFLVPICIVPVVSRAFFDTRLALFIHIITIILVGFLAPNSFEFTFMVLIAGIVAIMSVVKLERRAQFFYTAFWVFLSYALIYVGLSLIQDGSLEGITISNFTRYAANAAMILFAYPLIFLMEKSFGIITEVTLIELGNTNNKLLRQLSQKAPGTFQHSLQVANLSEEALYAIGGNALLVRVGALYHDIGKMDVPMYFIENQLSGFNPHDELTYEESASIIINHVIKGIERARKGNLPEEIIDFIRTHHGTRKVDYFYIQQRKENPGEEVDEKPFTYPGPKPFSKETAVLMMADSVEAASRSLTRPDTDSINDLVEKIINGQMDSGQFDNAPVTLRDITIIKRIFKRNLQNIFHVRIAYPDGS
jgi:hypothetical protein